MFPAPLCSSLFCRRHLLSITKLPIYMIALMIRTTTSTRRCSPCRASFSSSGPFEEQQWSAIVPDYPRPMNAPRTGRKNPIKAPVGDASQRLVAIDQTTTCTCRWLSETSLRRTHLKVFNSGNLQALWPRWGGQSCVRRVDRGARRPGRDRGRERNDGRAPL